MFGLEDKLAIRSGIYFRPEDFGGLLFDRDSYYIYELNHIGTEIFNLLNGENSISDIVNLFQEKYDFNNFAYHKVKMRNQRNLFYRRVKTP